MRVCCAVFFLTALPGVAAAAQTVSLLGMGEMVVANDGGVSVSIGTLLTGLLTLSFLFVAVILTRWAMFVIQLRGGGDVPDSSGGSATPLSMYDERQAKRDGAMYATRDEFQFNDSGRVVWRDMWEGVNTDDERAAADEASDAAYDAYWAQRAEEWRDYRE